MSEVKHTPGNWTAREGTTTGAEVVAKKPRGGDYVVARCGGKDREANARLIAAVPQMLAALKALTTDETADRVEYLINERQGGDCTILEAMEIAFEVAGVDAAIAAAGDA